MSFIEEFVVARYVRDWFFRCNRYAHRVSYRVDVHEVGDHAFAQIVYPCLAEFRYLLLFADDEAQERHKTRDDRSAYRADANVAHLAACALAPTPPHPSGLEQFGYDAMLRRA
jgi:hypothetical protein